MLASPASQRETQVLAAMPRRLKEELVQARLMRDSDEFVTNEKGDIAVDTLARTVQVKSEGVVKPVALPEGAYPLNVESVGFNLLKDHPGSIEIAGVILLMAMLGAVVLSRKQVELDEELKRRQAHTLAESADGGAA